MPAFKDQFLLDPSVTYLNHASFGAVPRTVFETYQKWQLALERQPVEFLYRREQHLMAVARKDLADFVNCHPDQLVYFPNATTALNAVLRSLPLSPGDEILTTDHEYGAMLHAMNYIAQKRDALMKVHPISLPLADEENIVASLWSAVTPHTRVIFISHITSPTAHLLPIKEIIRRAREEGIITVIDGAHTTGQISLDLKSLDADFYASNCHKWLCAPKGSAFLYAREELQSMLGPLVVSWGYQPLEPRANRFLDLYEWQGTRDLSPFLTVPAAIRYQQEHDWDSVRAECHNLAVETRERINALTGLPPLGPPESFSQMFSCLLPEIDPFQLKIDLYQRFKIEVPIFLWNDKNLLRVSIQAYNHRADADKLLSALKDLLPR